MHQPCYTLSIQRNAMAPRQRFSTHTVDEPPPIMAVASAASSSTSTSPTNTVTAPLLLADNNDDDSSIQPLRPSRESSFSDESEVSLTSTKSCSKQQPPLKNVATAYPNAAATAAAVATTDEASEISREQHDFFNLIALVRFGEIQHQEKIRNITDNKAMRFDTFLIPPYSRLVLSFFFLSFFSTRFL